VCATVIDLLCGELFGDCGEARIEEVLEEEEVKK